VRLDRLSAHQLDAFYHSLQEKGLSGPSIHQHHSILHASLRRAVKWGLIAANPADRATAPRPARSTATAPEVAEVQKLIAEAEADGNYMLATAIALGAVTGARRGELCALKWSDVDSGRRLLMVSRSLTVLAAKATEGPTKTHQRRGIAIDPALASLLAARRGQQESHAGLAGVELADDDLRLVALFRRLGTVPSGRAQPGVRPLGQTARYRHPFPRAAPLFSDYGYCPGCRRAHRRRPAAPCRRVLDIAGLCTRA
jgi:integrase